LSEVEELRLRVLALELKLANKDRRIDELELALWRCLNRGLHW
jgi:hypothetical protein